MTTQTQDLAQMIADAVARTDEPRPTTAEGGSAKGDMRIIGSVPLHLRHLHNLVSDLGDEAHAAAMVADAAVKKYHIVRGLFFESLNHHVPEPEDATDITLLGNWDVGATKDPAKTHGLGALVATLMAGGMRRD